MVNNIQLTWMLRTYRTCNSTVRFSKYEFYSKLLGSITLLRVTPNVTWTRSLYIYIYIYRHTPINLYLLILIVEVSCIASSYYIISQ